MLGLLTQEIPVLKQLRRAHQSNSVSFRGLSFDMGRWNDSIVHLIVFKGFEPWFPLTAAAASLKAARAERP